MNWFRIASFLLVLAAGTAMAAPPATTRTRTPMRLALQAASRGDITELTATLSVEGRLLAAPVLRLTLPLGAALVEGVPDEELSIPKDGGEIVRRFVVRGLGPGRLTVTAYAANRASGARVVASWPPPDDPESRPQPARFVPIPPVTAGGVRIESAIPLAPAKKQGE